MVELAMRCGSRASIALMFWVLSGCTEAHTPQPAAVSDSAGITIVANSPESIETAQTWILASSPILEIGSGASPEVPLFRVNALSVLADGRIAVGADGPPQALLFDSEGQLVATLGRAGQGPGEFSGVHSVVPGVGDSLVVWDRIRRRMSIFSGAGHYVREVDLGALALSSIETAAGSETPAGFSFLLPSSQGSVVLFGVGAMGPGHGVRRIEAPAYRITLDGEQIADFGSFPGIETYMSDETGIMQYPFGAGTYAVSALDALVVGTAETSEFRLYSPSGTLDRIVRWPEENRDAQGPIVDSWLAWFDEQLVVALPEGMRAGFREMVLGIQPERFPAYGGLVADDLGRVWVGAYPGQLEFLGYFPDARRVPERRWLIFDEDGVLTARLSTPEGFSPHTIRTGVMWGVFEDELGVESIRGYEVLES
jgi:hypothetical protein